MRCRRGLRCFNCLLVFASGVGSSMSRLILSRICGISVLGSANHSAVKLGFMVINQCVLMSQSSPLVMIRLYPRILQKKHRFDNRIFLSCVIYSRRYLSSRAKCTKLVQNDSLFVLLLPSVLLYTLLLLANNGVRCTRQGIKKL